MIFKMIKKILKKLLPRFILKKLKNAKEKIEIQKYKNLSLEKIFGKIYNEKIWTPENEKFFFKYYSGLGSHRSEFTEEYITKTISFLKTFEKKPNIVEFGCGDFEVSSKLVNFSNSFTACDIFENLIKTNKERFKDPKLKFLVMDMTKDQLPAAEICIVRCVLQHLSNQMIKNFLNNINGKFNYLLITEHFPSQEDFIPNKDIITGPNIRLSYDSAVDLAKSPFYLNILNEKNICKIYSESIDGFLNTQLYKLK